MSELPLYSGSVGINNLTSPHRLSYDKEIGVSALEDAVNFIVDRTGELVTRRGTDLKVTGSFHSLFPCVDWGLVALDRTADTAIYRVDVSAANKEISITGLRDGLKKGAFVEWCAVGDEDYSRVFYSNSNENGVVVDGSSSIPWPDDTANAGYIIDKTRTFSVPHVCDHMCFFAGRLYLSRNDSGRHIVEYTEFGRYGMIDQSRNAEVFGSKVVALIPAHDGIYISTEHRVYFLAGLNPKEWVARVVLEYPVIEWSVSHKPVDPSFFGFQTNTPSRIAGTVNGPVLFMPSGNVVNLIDKNVKTSGCSKASGVAVFDDSLVIQTGVGVK